MRQLHEDRQRGLQGADFSSTQCAPPPPRRHPLRRRSAAAAAAAAVVVGRGVLSPHRDGSRGGEGVNLRVKSRLAGF